MSTAPPLRVILGTMTFGPDPEKGARITSLDSYNQFLDEFQAAGYDEIDTARAYAGGMQESWTRDAGWRKRGLVCATKSYPFKPGTHSAEGIVETVNKSLSELGSDSVDIFYLHAADRSLPFHIPLEQLNKLHKEGKFRRLGLSNFAAYELAEVVSICRANGWVQPSIFQCMYNAITRSAEEELFPACRRYGLDIVVYNPLAGGLLSGKYKSDEIPKDGRFSEVNARQGEMYRKRYFQDATFESLRLLEPVAEEHNLTLIDIAMRWLVHHSALKLHDGQRDGIIIGVSSLEQLKQNIDSLKGEPLPDEVVKAVDQAWAVRRGAAPPYWHGELKYGYKTADIPVKL